MRKNWPFAIAVASLLVALVVSYLCLWNPRTTILIVRHAERADNTINSDLSHAGLDRADALVAVTDEAGVVAIYSTEFCRTAQTAQPVASALGMTLNYQQSDQSLDDCDPEIEVPTNPLPVTIATAQNLVDHLLAQHRGKTILVVGHSNTVPELIAALGQGDFAQVQIGNNEFDRLFIVTMRRYFWIPSLVKAQYGN